jgi:hypothetical protein
VQRFQWDRDELMVEIQRQLVYRKLRSEDHAAVFEQFKQVGDTLTDKPKGTGLGFADIAKEDRF